MDIIKDRVKEVFFLLASDSEVQIKSFPDCVDIAEEIAFETEEILNIIVQQNEMDNLFLETLRKIDFMFEQMNNDVRFWSVEGLTTHEIWQEIRKLAQAELKYQNIKYRFPNLFWLKYIKAD